VRLKYFLPSCRPIFFFDERQIYMIGRQIYAEGRQKSKSRIDGAELVVKEIVFGEVASDVRTIVARSALHTTP